MDIRHPPPKRQRAGWLALVGVWIGLILGGCVASVVMLARGASDPRWKYGFVLFVTSTIGILASSTIDRAVLRRSGHLNKEALPWGRALSKPVWITIGEYAFLLSTGTLVGGAVSLVGLPLVGAVVGVVSGAAFLFATFGTAGQISRLTFREGGLHVQVGSVRFLVPWKAIERTDSMGPKHYPMTVLKLRDRTAVLESVDPSEPASRRRVEAILGPDQQLILPPWTGGLDGATLRRFVDEARALG